MRRDETKRRLEPKALDACSLDPAFSGTETCVADKVGNAGPSTAKYSLQLSPRFCVPHGTSTEGWRAPVLMQAETKR